MNQNRLIINQVAGANIVEYELDLYDNVPLPINKSIIDIQNIAERKSDFSKTITLPGTHNNNDIFSNIFNLARSTENTNTYNFAPDFNPTLKADAILYKNGIAMIQGYLQLTNVSVTDEQEIEYEIIIIGRTANLFQDLGEKKLNELDLSAFNHTWNFTNIQNSWTPLASRGYYYGLIDQGQSNDQKGYYTKNMKPQIFAKAIVDAIFKDAGYRYSSDFFTTGNFPKLVVPCTQDKLLLTEQQVTDRTFLADKITDGSLITLPQRSFTKISFNNTVVQSNPTGYNNATYIFTVPTTGYYQFACNLNTYLEYNTGGAPNYSVYTYNYIVRKNSSVLFQTLRQSNTLISATTLVDSFTTQSSFLTAGDTIEVELFFEYTNSSINSINVKFLTGSEFFSIPSPEIIIGDTMELEKCLPTDIKQTDFLASIIKMFNLYVSVDALDNKKLKIETRDVYFTNDIVDFTNKVDISRGVQIKPLGALKYKDYTFAMQEDGDEANKLYQSTYTLPYGTKRYTVQNDFITESYKTDVVFAPTPLVASINQNVIFSQIVFKNSNNETINGTSKLRLLVAGGLSPVIATNYFNYDDPDGTQHFFDSYPYVGHYDNIAAPTFDINFDTPEKIYYKTGFQTAQTSSNLYNVYHKKGIEEITNKDSKLVEYYLKLSELEVNNLSFRNLYFIDKQYYRLYEVDFDSNSEEPAKLTFLKLAVAPAFVPYNLVTNGGIGEGSGYGNELIRNGNDYPKGVDVLVQGFNNTAQGYEQLVNSDGNYINANKVSALGGKDNTLLNYGGTYLNCDNYESERDNEVVVNNIDQPLVHNRILTVAELGSLSSTPIEIMAAHAGYWVEIYDAYITVFFGTTTPPTGYNNHKLHLQFVGDGTHILEFDNAITTASTATKQRGINISDTPFKDAAIEIHSAGNLGAAGNGQILIELEYRLHPIVI